MLEYSRPVQESLKEHGVEENRGLRSAEAEERLKRYGRNALRGKKPKSNLRKYLEQFKDVMILILLAAAAVSFVIACVERDPSGFIEPVLILVIVLLNAFIGVMQENRAERALDALKSLSMPHARVTRDGEERIIEASKLVPGDIIHLEAGDFVPADARLIAAAGLKCDESMLTGEAVPAVKDPGASVPEDAPLGDRSTMVYSGCSVVSGTASAVVTATGMDSEIGHIAGMLDQDEEALTPLQQHLAQLGKILGLLALVICAVIFVIGLFGGMKPLEIFMIAISLAVAAIPEGLPAIVTVVLSIGVQRLARKNAIIRRLPAVETLGSASVVCSDKTGTLTQNRMTLVSLYLNGDDSDVPLAAAGHAYDDLLLYGTLCADGSIRIDENGGIEHIGDPTETAVLVAARDRGLERDALQETAPRLTELPFDSDRKLMTSVNRVNGRIISITKGAFDMLVPRCISGDLTKANEINAAMSGKALRVIAVAAKELDALPETVDTDTLERDLHFVGLYGMIDPPRPEAADAVAMCRRAGIKPIMITGDHVITASAIAKDLGILEEGDRAVTGLQLDAMSEEELDAGISHIGVYARVSPENKLRIVRAWQRKKQVVAMTGDGVNDAPALKAADIGCAMGITGTDVAKNAADITLADDNFATIIDAIREGRGIYSNIRKVVGFLLGSNIGEILTVFFCMLFFRKSPLMSMQLLWINLVTDSLPAIALGMEAVEPDIMDKKPIPRDESFFAHGFGLRLAFQGAFFCVISLAAYYIGWRSTGSAVGAQTMAFLVLALSQIVQSFNLRSDSSLFSIGPFGNVKLDQAAVLSAALVALVAFTPLRSFFGLTLLSWPLYGIATALTLSTFVVMELYKLVRRLAGK